MTALALALGFCACPAFAAADASLEFSPSSATTATSKVKPRGERQLAPAERPTLKKKTEDAALAKRTGRINMQIPERLRAILEQRIEDRIDRDTAEEKALRREAMGLLLKFVGETPKGAAEMPEALLRLGELEWEDSRDHFLDAFKKWESTPADQKSA
ncbi:MAG TPA: hypothetical protein VH142_18340, partial [Polyangiaceae bacterium]|nr:hypothetical protein [Polyangiaceae bacterium]